MRACEKCHGPGPCLWSDQRQSYLCVKCHEDPNDEFFHRQERGHACPKCGDPLPIIPPDQIGLISCTVRCAGCDCSIGISLGSPPHVVFDPAAEK